jgi:hypothetical protein
LLVPPLQIINENPFSLTNPPKTNLLFSLSFSHALSIISPTTNPQISPSFELKFSLYENLIICLSIKKVLTS